MSSNTKLALYHYQACPFCALTRRAIDHLKVDVELRDTRLNSEHRSNLIQGGGKPQVPCLRIETSNGGVRWLYESQDIIAYLKTLADSQAA